VQATFVAGGLGVVVRIDDLGAHGRAELWVAEPAAARTWAERVSPMVARGSFVVAPLEGAGTSSHALDAGARVRIRRAPDAGPFEVLAVYPGVSIEVRLDARGAPPALSLAASDGGLSVQRLAGLGLSGRVQIGGETRRIEGDLAILEHVDATWPRAIRWSSAALLGRPAMYLSDLLVDAAAGPSENVAWSGAGARALGAADLRLADPARPGRGPWTIGSRDGRVALELTPRVVRVASRGQAGNHAWVLGTLAGVVDGATIAAGWGACEARDWR